MMKRKTFSNNVLEFNKWLAHLSFDLFDNYRITNPFNGKNKRNNKYVLSQIL